MKASQTVFFSSSWHVPPFQLMNEHSYNVKSVSHPSHRSHPPPSYPGAALQPGVRLRRTQPCEGAEQEPCRKAPVASEISCEALATFPPYCPSAGRGQASSMEVIVQGVAGGVRGVMQEGGIRSAALPCGRHARLNNMLS